MKTIDTPVLRLRDVNRFPSMQEYGFWIHFVGVTCGGVHEFAVEAFFNFLEGCLNRGGPLKFGAAYPLVIFYSALIFLKKFFEDFSFLTLKKYIENTRLNIRRQKIP